VRIVEQVSKAQSRDRVWAVVPVKRLALAKQHLAGVLGRRREQFMRILAAQTIDAQLNCPVLAGVVVVASDPFVARDARARGAVVVDVGVCARRCVRVATISAAH
jgi:2-phospho-L-lactate guanylyltransferase (CobY/MobA/RfbA family)